MAAKERNYIKNKVDQGIRDYERCANPKNRSDIDRLYNALEEWRLSAVAEAHCKSNSLVTKTANMNRVLAEETELIKKILQKQVDLSSQGKMREQELKIEKAARPFVLKTSENSKEIEVVTPDILTAQKLLVLYENLKMDCLTRTERMDLLLTVKKLAGSHPSQIACDLVALAERETELMLRDIPSPMLAGLRQRILQLFIQLCKKPEVNPSVSEFIPLPSKKDPNARTRMWNDTRRCISCGRYLRTRKFVISARTEHLAICTFCWRQENRGKNRVDLDPYRMILKDLRTSETELYFKMQTTMAATEMEQELVALDEAVEEQKWRRKHEFTPSDRKVVFNAEAEQSEPKMENVSDHLELLVTVHDIYYLVNKIWEGKSALSGCVDLCELRLCRWDVSQPWTPWNTILLTKKESDLHMQLNTLPSTSLYADALLFRIHQRLVIGKNTFRSLYKIGKSLEEETKRIWNGEDDKSYNMRGLPLTNNSAPKYIQTAEERQETAMKPLGSSNLSIRGEKRTSDYGINSIKEILNVPAAVEKES